MIYRIFPAVDDQPEIQICKICDANVTHLDHLEGCPGKIIDRMQYAVRVYGSNCGRSCCGYTDRTKTGENWEELVRDIVKAGSEARSPNYSVSFVTECDEDFSAVFDAEEKRRIEAHEAAKRLTEAQAKQARKTADLVALEARRGDYTEEAYARLKKEIEER
jgi:hypothetical protein